MLAVPQNGLRLAGVPCRSRLSLRLASPRRAQGGEQPRRRGSLAAATVVTGTSLAQLATPGGATAAVQHAAQNPIYHAMASEGMYAVCLSLGAVFAALTFATTGRFLLSL